MESTGPAAEIQACLTQWWQEAGTLSLFLPLSCREGWLDAVSQVIRCYRLLQNTHTQSERRLYRSLFQVGLSRLHAESISLFTAGYLPGDRLKQLLHWEQSLSHTPGF